MPTTTLGRFFSFAFPLTIAAALAWACSDSNGGSAGGSSGGASGTSGSSASDPPVSASQCSASCRQKATACQAPAEIASQQCSSICGGGVTQSQLTCLAGKSCAELGEINDGSSLEAVCPKASGTPGTGGTSGGSSTKGKFGDKCKCTADSTTGASEFDCAGTDVPCVEGLHCVGTRTQGVDDGTCVGPRCCSSQADCAAKLGKQSNCGSGQQCRCSRGDLECVGDTCTCSSGVAGSVGLCYK
jgi:hypothetical protein